MAIYHEMDIVLRIGFAHAAWLDVHPTERTNGTSSFSLTESLEYAESGQLEELLRHRGVECLACGRDIFECTEVVAVEVFADEIAIDGWGGTERGNVVLLHLA